MKIVKFLRDQMITPQFLMYGAGEIAGFEDELVARLINNHIAVLEGDGVPRGPDGSLVVAKTGLTRARELLGEALIKAKA